MTGPLVRGFEVVIGLETHVQLSTRSKIFSGASTAFGAAPNTQASAVDVALPGTLPVANRGAVERAIRFGLAVGGKVAPLSIFARKNYFYPDLPKGYQISQYETPVVQGGAIEFLLGDQHHRVQLTRAHLEEDAGKSVHGLAVGDAFGEEGGGSGGTTAHGDGKATAPSSGWSGIDLNRAGTPLLEVVSEPDMRSSAEAVEYARTLHALVVWLDICDGNMQEGSFRCDANVSVRRPGAPYGTRREIKNLNSFRFLQQAIDHEVQQQIDLIEDGGTVAQATVLFDAVRGETRAMRSKEDAHDYRYFPDPDLPPLAIDDGWVERVRAEMPELPRDRARRFQDAYGLNAYDAAMMTQSKSTAAYFEAAAQPGSVEQAAQPGGDEQAAGGGAVATRAKLVANWIMGEATRRLHAEALDAIPFPPAALAALVARQHDKTISSAGAKQVFDALWNAGGGDVDRLIEARGLRQVSDAGELDALVDRVIAANAKSVVEFKAGKDKALNALVGQAMKASGGKADPTALGAIFRSKLADG